MSGAGETVPQRPRRRRALRRLVIAVTLVFAFVIAAGAFLLRSDAGSELLAERLAEAIDNSLPPGSSAAIGSLAIELSGGWEPEVFLRDVAVTAGAGHRLSIDELQLSLPWGALFGSGTVSALAADHVLLDIQPDGKPLPDLSAVLLAADGIMERAGLVRGDIAALTVQRRVGGLTQVFVSGGAVTLRRSRDRGLEVRLDGPEGWDADLRLAPEDEGRALVAELSAFPISRLMAAAGAGALPVGGYFDGELTARLDDTGKLSDARGWIAAEPLAGGGELLMVERTRLDLAWRPENRILSVGPSTIAVPDGHVVVEGRIDMSEPVGRVPFSFDLDVESGDSRIEGIGLVAGYYDLSAGVFSLERISGRSLSLDFEASAILAAGPSGPVAGIAASMPRIGVDVFKDAWPSFLLPRLREWVMANVNGGTIEDARLEIGLDLADMATVDPGSTTTLDFRFSNAGITPLPDGPTIIGASGALRLAGGSVEVVADSGTITGASGETVAVSSASFRVADLTARPQVATATFALAGSAAGMLDVTEALPFPGVTGTGVAVADLSGEATADVSVTLPLVDHPAPGEIGYLAVVNLADVALAEPFEGREVAEGALRITVADGLADISGTARVDGVAADISVQRPLDGSAGRSAVRLTLDDADRTQLGLGLDAFLSGPISVAIEVDPETGEQKGEVDLTEARMVIDALGWEKAAGAPGSARFVLREGDGGATVVDGIALTAGDARVEGRVRLASGGGLVSADLPVFRLREGDRLALEVDRGQQGVTTVRLTGARFDARGLIRGQLSRTGPGVGAASDTVVVVSAIDEVIGFGEERLLAADLSTTVIGGQVGELVFSAQTEGGGATSGTVTAIGDGNRRVVVEAGEIGRLLRFLDVYSRLQGGRGTLVGTLDPAGALVADVDSQRLVIVDEPAMDLFATAAPDETGLQAVTTAEILRSLVQLRFQDGVLTLSDVIVRTAGAGLSLQGDIDFRGNELRIAGSYLPASAFDSLLGRIPILGQTLFAGGRAGVFGVTFGISGAIGDPTLTINPLSIIAPGIFRKLFELG